MQFPLAELDAADLAGDGLGQLDGELDFARVLVGRGDGPAVLLELGDQGVGALVAGGEVDRLDAVQLPNFREGQEAPAAAEAS